MSESTKVIVPPDEAEAGMEDASGSTVVATPPVADAQIGAGIEPGPSTRGAFGVEEYTATPAAPERAVEPASDADDATAGQTDVAAADARTEEAVAETSDALQRLRKARDTRQVVEGRVFGWNPGGFHVVIDGLAAFCPRSEMELEPIADPESYLDKTFTFRVLKIQGKGRRIVLSRTAILREEQHQHAKETAASIQAGQVLHGKVASLTDFGAFVDLGGVEGLVHVSEISRERVHKPADRLQVGQEVEVKVLKVEKGGRRISLSMKALEPDPWREIRDKYPEGAVVTGTVERTDKPGAFIQLEPGLVGLLPTSEMGLPREAIPARAYPKGKEVRVQVVGIDPKRKRISLAPEGSQIEGTRGDYQAYVKQQRRDSDTGLNALAAAFSKLKRSESDQQR